jgi:hypothetical protein
MNSIPNSSAVVDHANATPKSTRATVPMTPLPGLKGEDRDSLLQAQQQPSKTKSTLSDPFRAKREDETAKIVKHFEELVELGIYKSDDPIGKKIRDTAYTDDRRVVEGTWLQYKKEIATLPILQEAFRASTITPRQLEGLRQSLRDHRPEAVQLVYSIGLLTALIKDNQLTLQETRKGFEHLVKISDKLDLDLTDNTIKLTECLNILRRAAKEEMLEPEVLAMKVRNLLGLFGDGKSRNVWGKEKNDAKVLRLSEEQHIRKDLVPALDERARARDILAEIRKNRSAALGDSQISLAVTDLRKQIGQTVDAESAKVLEELRVKADQATRQFGPKTPSTALPIKPRNSTSKQ